MKNNTPLTILISVILTIIVVSIVNVGITIILEQPTYEDYCDSEILKPIQENMTQEEQIEINRQYEECYSKYDDAQKPYNQYRYYILAGVGLVLLLVGLYSKENIIRFSGLASGGILILEGVVVNFQNKLIVFFSLIGILIIFGLVSYKVINKKK